MRIGFNPANFEMITEVLAVRPDYLELPINKIVDDPPEKIDELRRLLQSYGVLAECFNVLLKSGQKITDDGYDRADFREYLDKAFYIMKSLGGCVAVFGSGDSRRISDFSKLDKCAAQVEDFVGMLDDYAKEYGMRIAIEPLSPDAVNYINTVAQAYELASRVDSDYVGVLADLYHMPLSGDDFSNIVKAADKLLHIHIANPTDRKFPREGDGYDGYALFFDALRKANYNGRITVEASTDDIAADAKLSLKFLEKYSHSLN